MASSTHLKTLFKCEKHVLVVPASCSCDKAYLDTLRSKTTGLVHQVWFVAERGF
ncbi:MAG TPA: hypothetical protein VK674_00635 [Candidatus Limnocylindria bacterium]|nr:hypothetical protein [Candidatus Limnocylindria bacterium]